MTAIQAATGERVLVVDDEADIVALVAYHLVKAGYRVSTASSGPDALGAARQERPALVVLDLMLPGASGYDVLESETLRAGWEAIVAATHAARLAHAKGRKKPTYEDTRFTVALSMQFSPYSDPLTCTSGRTSSRKAIGSDSSKMCT